MELMGFGEGWLGEILGAARVSGEIRDKVRSRISSLEEGGKGRLEAEWKTIDGLLEKGRTGEALEEAMGTVAWLAGELHEMLGDGAAVLERPFSPFLIKDSEVRAVLHPSRDVHEMARSRDELDVMRALELINDARRLLASWGAGSWGRKPHELIPRLEEDVEGLRRTYAELPGDEGLGGEDLEKEIELADRFATMATRFAHDLMELHALNAVNPEVRMRFEILWDNVKQLEEEGDVQAAALEALQVLEEGFEMAGMGGGDTLEKIDMLYDFFSEVEELRSAVDRLTEVLRDGRESIGGEEGRSYIDAIGRALSDMRLKPA